MPSIHISIGGSVVECSPATKDKKKKKCSPATRAARVRFPADAAFVFISLNTNSSFKPTNTNERCYY